MVLNGMLLKELILSMLVIAEFQKGENYEYGKHDFKFLKGELNAFTEFCGDFLILVMFYYKGFGAFMNTLGL